MNVDTVVKKPHEQALTTLANNLDAINGSFSGNAKALLDSIFSHELVDTSPEHIIPEWTDQLTPVLQRVLYAFKYQAFAKNVILSVKCDSRLPKVYWDLDKVHYYILNNLVANALQFTQAGGKIELSAHAEKHNVVFKISDNASGLPFSERKKLLLQIEKDSFDEKQAHGSTALRLHNASLLAKHHDGRIDVEEGLEHKGSSFRVTLPAVPFTLLKSSLIAKM